MENLYSGWLMKLLEKWHVPAYKRFGAVRCAGAACFLLAILLAVIAIGQAWPGNAVIIGALAAAVLAGGYLFFESHLLWLPMLLSGAAGVIAAFAVEWKDARCMPVLAVVGSVMLLSGATMMWPQIRMSRLLRQESKLLRKASEWEKR